MNENVSIAILAGGLSIRMGRDKSFVELAGKPLIAHVIEQVSQLALPIMIITNQAESYQAFGLPLFADVLPSRSSLTGLYSALYHSASTYTLCVACDMPFLNPNLLTHLIRLCEGYDAVVPILDGHAQALHAVYNKTCLAPLRQQYEQNRLRIRDLYPQISTCWVDEITLRKHDPHLTSVVNINTPEALLSTSVLSNQHKC